MEIRDTFHVSTSIDDTWKVLLDVERIAPCLPGARLQEAEGDEYRGVVKVKVGPITSQYKGSACLSEVDAPSRRVVIEAKGRDTRGAGDAKASIILTMREDGPGTAVDVVTDLHVTGRVATLGRGMLEGVSARLLGQFAENLERNVLAEGSGEHAPERTSAADGVPRGAESPSAGPAPSLQEAGSLPTAPGDRSVRRIDAPEAEPVDLLAAAGRPLLLRIAPTIAALVVLIVLWRLLGKRD